MRNTRTIRRLTLVLPLVLAAAACGGDDDGSQATVATTPAATQPSGTQPAATQPAATDVPATGLKFGMILVGPYNDHGWSQAHYDAGKYLEDKLGATMIYLDKVNVADLPDKTVDQVAAEMISQGAQMVFMTSDDMKDGALAAAAADPAVPMVWSSGDSAWADGEAFADLPNLGNVMGRMEYGKMIAGCAAALTTQTGKISYLGPLVNDETRRLVNSAYLGAKYCHDTFRADGPALSFEVTYIGFWFNIPGVTLDPTQVVTGFFDGGADVVLSGIDTTEALKVAGQRASAGESVWAVPYDFKGACDEAPDACLGVPYFNWGPAYLEIAQSVIDGTFAPTWEWNGPDWSNINNADTSAVGFVDGPGLSADNKATLDTFIAGLADGSIDLFTGPLNYQDGSVYLAAGETATDQQIWYTKGCLEGISGVCESQG
jgi:simple sugar transport system substrate-binding protein